MATVTKLGLGDFQVEGEFNRVEVLMSLDDMHGVLYHVWSNEEKIGVFSDRDAAIEFAEKVCDNETFDEIGDGMSDVEADADALASAGWGTAEDYGCYGDDY